MRKTYTACLPLLGGGLNQVCCPSPRLILDLPHQPWTNQKALYRCETAFIDHLTILGRLGPKHVHSIQVGMQI